MATHRFQGPLGTSPVDIDQGTLCRNQSPVPGPIDAERTFKHKNRPWMVRDIDGYHEWVQKHAFEYVSNLKIDCADFAIYLLNKYAEDHPLRLGFVASFSFRDPFASRRMVNPTLSESMARLGAEDLFDGGRPYRVFNSDTKVRIRSATGTRFYYPDAMVICDQNPPTDSFQDASVVIVEVVSESTRRIDEGEKKEEYLTISSLQTYIILEQDKPEARVFQRGAAGFEQFIYCGLDAIIPLSELRIALSLKDIYQQQ